jgi:hypothetical protein
MECLSTYNDSAFNLHLDNQRYQLKRIAFKYSCGILDFENCHNEIVISNQIFLCYTYYVYWNTSFEVHLIDLKWLLTVLNNYINENNAHEAEELTIPVYKAMFFCWWQKLLAFGTIQPYYLALILLVYNVGRLSTSRTHKC